MHIRRQPPRTRRRAAGFTLIEALVAFLVTAFGMLAIAGMQLTVSRSSEVAKQRSEAVRLAQQKIEQLRAFEKVASDVAKWDYTDDVVSGNDTISPTSGDPYSTNTSYGRVWTITRDGTNPATGSDLQKWIRVVVSWADRTNQTQNVTLTSVISRADPFNLGTLLTGPGGTQVRRPKNRDINIPYPAISLPGDMSSFKPPPSTTNYVFNNTTGNVLGFCSDAAIAEALDGDGTDDIINFGDDPLTAAVETATAGCTAQPGYLLSGYIRFLTSLPSGNEFAQDSAITNPTTATKELSAQIVFTSVGGSGTPLSNCFAQRQKVVSVGNITVRDIATVSRVSNIVTVTTTAAHGFSAGQIVAINNVSLSFDGTFTILTASGSTFTYAHTAANATPTIGSPTPTAALVQQVTIEDSPTAPAPPTGYNTVVSRFVAYTCVVQGIDDTEAPQPSPASMARWWGQFVITPLLTSGDSVVWTLGTGEGNWKVCRFTGDYIADDVISNSEHPLYYRGVGGGLVNGTLVSGSLDSQNYLVVPGNVSCPTDAEADPLNGANDYSNTNTVRHQTESVSTGTSPYGGVLSTSSNQWPASGNEKAATDLTPLPMF